MTLRKSFDVLIVGGGPAGMAAGASAGESGLRVGIVDDNLRLGGQIWRSDNTHVVSPAADWIKRLKGSAVEVFSETRVFQPLGPQTLLAEGGNKIYELSYKKLILATGARERFLPFPGWTIPKVMGAGGLQAMVKSGLPIAGERVVIAGTGPLLFAVASYLHKHGALISLLCEQASLSSLVRFASCLLRQPGKPGQALSLRKDLAGVHLAFNSWVVEAHGEISLEAVTVSRNGKLQTIACDYLACGFHLVPNVELALLLGCALSNGYLEVDDLQQTSVANVFCAGEPTGIGGLDASLLEGQIAGYAASGHSQKANQFLRQRDKQRKFAAALDHTYQLRPELKELVKTDTIVCRCEDVTYGRLKQENSWREAKLYARCGMGPCQGRVCGPATKFLFHWNPESVRPPLSPVRVDSFLAKANNRAAELSAASGENK
jgi:NADPH-dependent 2,4-dienoyl-CoA reductase/sulfur reductase-like enzyme